MGDVIIDVVVMGIVFLLFSIQEIVVQCYDISFGVWMMIVNIVVGDFVNLFILIGSGVILNLSGLGEGQYWVFIYNISLFVIGLYISLDVDVYQISVGIISGLIISIGNVMVDDIVLMGIMVIVIINVNGVSMLVGVGGVDIQG